MTQRVADHASAPGTIELPPPPPGKSGWPWFGPAEPLLDYTSDGSPWPKISVVTPSYNQGEFLEATIRSVLLQGYPNLEYVVIDGASTDNSRAIIDRYAPWLTYWVSEQDRGHGHALNKGFAQSTGDIMAWINSDDMYHSGAFALLAEIFSTLPEVEWLQAAPSNWDARGRVIRIDNSKRWARAHFLIEEYEWIQQESVFWRRSLWDRVGGAVNESIRMAVDFDLWLRFFREARLCTVQVLVGGYRRHPEARAVTCKDEHTNIVRGLLAQERQREGKLRCVFWDLLKLCRRIPLLRIIFHHRLVERRIFGPIHTITFDAEQEQFILQTW